MLSIYTHISTNRVADDIADEVHVVLDNEIITWPPMQIDTAAASSKQSLDQTDGADETGTTTGKPPKKKTK